MASPREREWVPFDRLRTNVLGRGREWVPFDRLRTNVGGGRTNVLGQAEGERTGWS